MHTLMNLAGSVGTLHADSGLEEILKSTFGGVQHMLSGKKFPQNICALCMVAEELVCQVLIENNSPIRTMSELLSELEEKATHSRT